MTLQSLFPSKAQTRFEFLVDEFGFSLESTESRFVVYRSGGIEISIFYDEKRHHELDLSVRRIGDNPRYWPEYGIYEFRAAAGGGPAEPGNSEASTPDEL